MGTQTKIVRSIQEKKADYVLSLKRNHPTLYAEVEQKFNPLKNNGVQSGNLTMTNEWKRDITTEKKEKFGRFQ